MVAKGIVIAWSIVCLVGFGYPLLTLPPDTDLRAVAFFHAFVCLVIWNIVVVPTAVIHLWFKESIPKWRQSRLPIPCWIVIYLWAFVCIAAFIFLAPEPEAHHSDIEAYSILAVSVVSAVLLWIVVAAPTAFIGLMLKKRKREEPQSQV